jgi:hypothetical protein
VVEDKGKGEQGWRQPAQKLGAYIDVGTYLDAPKVVARAQQGAANHRLSLNPHLAALGGQDHTGDKAESGVDG